MHTTAQDDEPEERHENRGAHARKRTSVLSHPATAAGTSAGTLVVAVVSAFLSAQKADTSAAKLEQRLEEKIERAVTKIDDFKTQMQDFKGDVKEQLAQIRGEIKAADSKDALHALEARVRELEMKNNK